MLKNVMFFKNISLSIHLSKNKSECGLPLRDSVTYAYLSNDFILPINNPGGGKVAPANHFICAEIYLLRLCNTAVRSKSHHQNHIKSQKRDRKGKIIWHQSVQLELKKNEGFWDG